MEQTKEIRDMESMLKNDNKAYMHGWHEITALEADLKTARETNARLNRLNQKLESMLKNDNKAYMRGWRHAWRVCSDDLTKTWEKKFELYKASTRKEMRKAREE